MYKTRDDIANNSIYYGVLHVIVIWQNHLNTVIKKQVKGISRICCVQDKRWYCQQQYLVWCFTCNSDLTEIKTWQSKSENQSFLFLTNTRVLRDCRCSQMKFHDPVSELNSLKHILHLSSHHRKHILLYKYYKSK